MTRTKKIVATLVGIILAPFVLALVALIIINVVDWDRHRGFVKSMVERFTDYEIDEIEGIKVGLLSSARAGVSKIKLRQTNPYSSFKSFESKQVLVQIRVFPLLFSDQLIVENFFIDGARINLKTAPSDPNAKPEDEKPLDLATLPAIFVKAAGVDDFTLVSEGIKKNESPTRLRIENAGISSPNNAEPSRLVIGGKVNDLPIEAFGAFGSFDAFRDKSAAYPARIEAKIADHKLDARGNLHFAKGTADFDVDASGPGLTQIKKALHLNIGDIPAYTLSFAIHKKPDVFRFEEIKLNVGKSSAFGNAGLNFAGKRPLIQADLQSPGLYGVDFKGLFQTDKSIGDPDDVPKPAGQYFSDKPIDASAIKSVNADISLDVKRFEGEKAGQAIDGANARIKLNNGLLVADPLRFAVAAGTIGGDLMFDARKSDIQVKINLGARRIDLDALLGPIATELPVLKIKPTDIAKGLLTGNMALTMHGPSPMAMAKTVDGPLALAVENGKFSATIVELAGIDITEALGDFLLKHPMKDLQCGLLSFEANKGVYETKTFLLATTDTNFLGNGKLDLPGNKVDFRLSANPRDFSIGSIRTPIYLRGPLNDIEAGLEKKDLIIKGAAAVVLGAINPALALLPLIEPGMGKKGECGKYLDQIASVQADAKKNVSGKDLDATKAPGQSVGR